MVQIKAKNPINTKKTLHFPIKTGALTLNVYTGANNKSTFVINVSPSVDI
jgi:hypothetical protein